MMVVQAMCGHTRRKSTTSGAGKAERGRTGEGRFPGRDVGMKADGWRLAPLAN